MLSLIGQYQHVSFYFRFGIPVAINVTTDLSFKQIQVIIRKNMSSVVRNTLNKVVQSYFFFLFISNYFQSTLNIRNFRFAL